MKKDKKRILFVASEVAPLVKTGGLADVAQALPQALHDQGHDVRICMPCYRGVPPEHRGGHAGTVIVNLGGQARYGGIRSSCLPGSRLPLYLIEHEGYFDREHPYGRDREYADNCERFAFFCAAVLDAIPQLGWQPDVVHCNDWHTALLPVYLREGIHPSRVWRGMPTVFTIHNLGYQGRYGQEEFAATGLAPALFSPDGLEFEGGLNLMKGGIGFAHKVNTVSATYAREIQTPRFGQGLDGFLRTRRDDLSGIVNGIDPEVWNPQNDPHTAAAFSQGRMGGKTRCKEALRKALDLPAGGAPLFAMVTRLVWAKGMGLVLGAIEEVLPKGIQFAVLGTGDRQIEVALTKLAAQWPEQVSVRLTYDEALSHQFYAGADFFVMPSLFEPCGLSQLYSLRYGTAPIVRKTGGLADTVTDASPANLAKETATGIVFAQESPAALRRAFVRALHLYEDDKAFKRVRRTGMQEDHSWDRASRQYVDLYEMAAESAAQARALWTA